MSLALKTISTCLTVAGEKKSIKVELSYGVFMIEEFLKNNSVGLKLIGKLTWEGIFTLVFCGTWMGFGILSQFAEGKGGLLLDSILIFLFETEVLLIDFNRLFLFCYLKLLTWMMIVCCCEGFSSNNLRAFFSSYKGSVYSFLSITDC